MDVVLVVEVVDDVVVDVVVELVVDEVVEEVVDEVVVDDVVELVEDVVGNVVVPSEPGVVGAQAARATISIATNAGTPRRTARRPFSVISSPIA